MSLFTHGPIAVAVLLVQVPVQALLVTDVKRMENGEIESPTFRMQSGRSTTGFLL